VNTADQRVLVRGEHVSRVYNMGETRVQALDDVSFAIHRADFVAFVGPSGCGKTSILNLIGCLEKPDIGRIEIDGKATNTLSEKELAGFRSQRLGFVFQNFNLLPVLTALENVEYGLIKKIKLSAEREVTAGKWLDRVGLGKHGNHLPSQLSGGQRQRVAIARALAHGPDLVVADEPTANLDHKTAMEVIDLMKTLNNELGVTFVFSTHDPKIMAAASRVITLEDGRIIS
jgi:putative ABC transport system ATP-binding protein